MPLPATCESNFIALFKSIAIKIITPTAIKIFPTLSTLAKIIGRKMSASSSRKRNVATITPVKIPTTAPSKSKRMRNNRRVLSKAIISENFVTLAKIIMQKNFIVNARFNYKSRRVKHWAGFTKILAKGVANGALIFCMTC